MIGRYLAPAGAPIRTADLLRWAARCGSISDAETELEKALTAIVGRRHCALMCTGRAGLSVLLASMKALAPAGRDEVVLPSYTCYSVAASAVRAGLRPRIVDVDRSTLDFDLDKLARTDFRRVVAIVVTNLYGLPGNLPYIARIAADNGVFLVDDAAQSLGARVGGRASGSWGDAGLISFDKGKPVSAIDGGAIVTDSNALAEGIRERMESWPRPEPFETVALLVKVAAYAACLHPRVYWLPNSLPGIGLGQTPFQPDTKFQRSSRWLSALATTMLPRLTGFNAHRVAMAARFHAGLRGAAYVTCPQPASGSVPTYLRLPLLARDRSLRDALIAGLQRAGIGATASYPGSIADIPELRPHLASPPDSAAGRDVADRILTLPTHSYVREADADRALSILAAVATESRPVAVGATA